MLRLRTALSFCLRSVEALVVDVEIGCLIGGGRVRVCDWFGRGRVGYLEVWAVLVVR